MRKLMIGTGRLCTDQVNELYAIERACKERQLDYDQIREIRQKESVPILDDLHKWMQQKYQTLPSAPITAV